MSVLQPFKIVFNQPLDANKHLHPPQIVAPNSPSCASPSFDDANTSLTDDPLDNPEKDAIYDTSIKDKNDAISETTIDDNDDHTDKDDPIPIDEIEEPLTPINNLDASDTCSNFDDAPPLHIIDRDLDPFPLFHLSPLYQPPSSLEDVD